MDQSEIGGGSQFRAGAWCCPIDRAAETNGQHPFVALRPCGHVLRKRVVQECSAKRTAAVRMSSCGAASVSRDSESSAQSTGDGSKVISDGISTIHGGQWSCPVCTLPVEVSVLLFPEEAEVERARRGLVIAAEGRRQKKRKREMGGGAESTQLP
jgi:hypothetical protein